MKKRNLLVRVLSGIWSGVDSFRKVLHLLLLLFVFAIFVGALSGTTPMLPDRAALTIKPVGVIVEELEGDPFDRAIAELLDEAQPQTVLQDIVDALDYAKGDERIAAVHIELSSLGAAGLPKLQRIARAIEDFQESGKPVIASADFMTQQGYFIAAHADEVYLHPQGGVLLQGYGRFRSYFSDAIEKLKLDWNIFKVGTYKSAVEPFERMDMSEADREASLLITGTGDVLEPERGIVAMGSGGAYAQAAAIALLDNTDLAPADIVKKSLEIAGDICIYTNQNHVVETLPA